jgi:hypothetical protein
MLGNYSSIIPTAIGHQASTAWKRCEGFVIPATHPSKVGSKCRVRSRRLVATGVKA